MRARTLLTALATAALAACAAGQGMAQGAGSLPGHVFGCVPGSVHAIGTSRVTYAAAVLRPLAARRSLEGGESSRFEKTNVNGVATVFAVLAERVDRACRPVEYEVQLPIRPNGSTGWVNARDVRLRTLHLRIAVDLSQRRITVFRDGRPVLRVSAVVGAPSTPTPTGRFYVNQRLRTRNPFGDYGPGAVGISAFSPVLRNWPQGGPIAIHGTNAPGLIGFAVSHGCLRVRNVDIEKLLRIAEEGTPVEIRR